MTLVTNNGTISVRLATTFDALLACQAVRASAFIARGEPFHEEFDGNDLVCAAHFLARKGHEPVGTMRLRIIDNETIIWERLAVVPSARNAIRILKGLADAAEEYSMSKHMRRAIGSVADERLLKFWRVRGFHTVKKPPHYYNNIEYRSVERIFNYESDASERILPHFCHESPAFTSTPLELAGA